jgi:hypothetical protein
MSGDPPLNGFLLPPLPKGLITPGFINASHHPIGKYASSEFYDTMPIQR